MVVFVVTSHSDVDVKLSVVDVDAHLIFAVVVKDLLDVLVCKPPVGKNSQVVSEYPSKSPATAWITAYCFMVIELKFEVV